MKRFRIESSPSVVPRLGASLANRRTFAKRLGGIAMTASVTDAVSGWAADPDLTPEKKKALLITGGCCHDYSNQKRIIVDALGGQQKNDWTILQYGDRRDVRAEIYESRDWIRGYDIVVHNECFGAVDDPSFIKGIVDAHASTGVPAIMIHCSMHSYRNAENADAWRGLIGITSRRHEKSKRSLTVQLTDAGTADPITAHLGDGWQTPNGELYLVEKVWPDVTVLATARSTETDSDHPIAWKHTRNGVPVFATTLGHHNETMLDPNWQKMLSGGWAWCLQQ